MRAAAAILFALCSLSACATAEDVDGAATPKGDAVATADTSEGETSAPSDAESDTESDDEDASLDTAATPDTSTGADSAASDTGASDTGASDTGSVEDSGTVDTGSTTDTGSATDTGTTMCGPSGEYWGKCKTNVDCAALGCGYVCCAYDPTKTFPIGCGKIAGGGICLP